MKTTEELISEISITILEIQTNYPELYIYLDEIPITIPNQSDPKIDVKALEDYQQSLKEMLSNYRKNHSS